MASKYLIDLVLRLVKQGTGGKDVEKELEGVAKAGKKVGDSWKSLVAGGAAVAGALVTVKKAFDWGQEGAAIAQTGESFDLLMTKVGGASDLLQQLRDASRNTISDMDLMSSTTTLLAGAQGALATQLAAATPELLEIAKAANKLNPSLGDTTFLYNSLATGVKRAQPLILDNLGLTLKIGEANKAYAAILGKTVEQLTAEEQKQALLNATLEAGRVLVDQAGGTTEAMGDSFAQAEAKIKNATDSLKKEFAPAVAAVLNFVAEKTPEVMTTTEQLSRMAEGVISVAEAFISGESTSDAWEMAILDSTVAMIENLKASQQMADAYGTSETRFIGAERALAAYKDVEVEAEENTKDLEKATASLADAVAAVQERYEGFYGTLASGLVGFRDLQDAQKQSADDYESALADLQQRHKSSMAGIKMQWEESLPDATDVSERMGMMGDAWDEWGLRLQDIMQNGVASPWYQTLQEMGMVKPPDQGISEWAQDLKNQFYQGELPNLINEQSAAWQEHAQIMRQSQAEATAAYNQESANRQAAYQNEVAALKAARDEQLAAEAEQRKRATLELGLQLAEQSGMLAAWSQQEFGPDFSGIGDSASEVIALIDSGMVAVDGSLKKLIASTTAGVQEALDTTGSLAEANKKALDEVLTADYDLDAQKEKIKAALNIADALAPEDAQAAMATIGESLTTSIPEDPFAALTGSFTGAAAAILGGAGEMEEGLLTAFQNILTLGSTPVSEAILQEWIGGSVFPDLASGAGMMQSTVSQAFQAIGGASRAMAATVQGGLEQMISTTDALAQTLGKARKGFNDVKSSAEKLLKKVNELISAYRTLISLINESGFTDNSPPPYSEDFQEIAQSAGGLAATLNEDLQQGIMSAGRAFRNQLSPGAINLGGINPIAVTKGMSSVPSESRAGSMVQVSGDRHTWNIYDQGSMRLAWALANERREQRLNSFMGVG